MSRNDGLTVSNSTSKWAGCRGSIGVTQHGKYYYECCIGGNANGICRVGWSTLTDKLNLGVSATGYGYGGTGKKVNNNTFTDYGDTFSTGDRIGCCLDLDAGSISFTKNGTDLGIAFSGINSALQYYPTICLKDCSVNVVLSEPFESVPSEYCSISEAPKLKPQSTARTMLALILEPTRELAEQTYDCLIHFASFMNHPLIRVV